MRRPAQACHRDGVEPQDPGEPMRALIDPSAVEAVVAAIRSLASMVAELPPKDAAPAAIVEDLAVIHTQSRNATTAMQRLVELAPQGNSSELEVLLHRLNNFFTGIASLATLCRDDVRGAPDLHARLVEVEQQARRAADSVRELARGHR